MDFHNIMREKNDNNRCKRRTFPNDVNIQIKFKGFHPLLTLLIAQQQKEGPREK